MKTFQNQAAQGDFLITRVDALPAAAVPDSPDGAHFVIAHSETGHNHVIERANATLYRLPESIYEAFLVVDAPAVIEHRRSFDTHAPLRVEPGVYRINRQREYAPEGSRRAQD